MRKFIIVGKTTGAVMLYDADYGGMAIATYYTVRQLISMGATVIGMKANTKQFSCYVMDKNENRSLGAGVPVVGTKRSASTFMKGIKDPAKEQAKKEAKKKEQERIEQEKEYTIEAYDKDNDVWETLYKCNNKYVTFLLADFAGKLVKKDMLIRYPSGGGKEPFDWIEVRENDNRIKVFPERKR